ncbi:hypothetical protein CRG98_030584 [Punica granatum]|uniref:Thaumatin-like protein n=1 Tax=Punica granatum TaxID=22663 RepID=A0A2I0IYB1_PUNGR|nr:hypothetical protein CRG98_030584 [Punica granatum]
MFLSSAHATNYDILNQCNYTVWAAASPGGGRRLDPGQSWSLTMNPDTTTARIWGRTNCSFDANGQGRYFFDISLVDGFNIPVDLKPATNVCRGIQCSADINGQCPAELRAPGGCNNPCTVFKTNEYCCTNGQGSCGPTTFSKFFKDRCPDAYSYPQDDSTSTLKCPSGTNYRVTFCP